MLRNICLIFCLLSFIPLAIGCSKIESTVNEEFEVPHSFDVPSEYNHAKVFLDSITKQGIRITEINNSNMMALFQTNYNYAMSVKSESGNFVLIHLENKNGKEFNIENKESVDGRFKYLINKNGESVRLYDSNSKTYFNKNDEYITITQSKELNKILKKVIE
ncbi:hypothetical protein [Bacillus sp. OAE603]|uniref:hypothetical protein n=1 Tax=Gottfriedia sp. OAE603 TaxID=2663872 RepID=UPI00178BC231